MFVETIHEMESRRMQKNCDRRSQGEACNNDSVSTSAGAVSVQDIHWQEDRYVVAEEKASIFKGTFSAVSYTHLTLPTKRIV